MPDSEQAETLAVNYVLLDTNILRYLNTPTIREGLLGYLSEIIEAGYKLAISDFVIFESFARIPKSKENQLISTLETLARFEVNWQVLLAAGQITTIYSVEKAEYNHITQGDKVIAATAVLNNSPILTADCNDFPRPFFTELHKKFIFYKEKNRDKLLVAYLLAPDLELINIRHNNRP